MILFTLLTAGVFAGLIQYFVDFKKLPIDNSLADGARGFEPGQPPSWLNQLWLFIKGHWQFFAYIIIGITGALMLPMINTLTDLKGIEKITNYTASIANSTKTDLTLDNWDLLVLFGYGVVFGYSAVRIIRSIGFLILGNVTTQQEDLKKSLDDALLKINELTAKLQQPTTPQTTTSASFATLLNETPELIGDYVNKTQNESDKRAYYSKVDLTSPITLFDDLHKLLSDTHKNKLPYKPSLYLYPKVDRYNDGFLRSIYSGKPFNLTALLELDAKVDQRRALALANTFQANFSSVDFNDQVAQIEEQLPYNCEHVVPQSWFMKRDPMKGDLHHLFTCEMECNRLRDDDRYVDFVDYEVNTSNLVRADCGKSESNLFEPEINKGVVARATLYFLVRYPSVFEQGKGYTLDDVPILLKWHDQHKVNAYELHRNQQIFNIQGNRNPFIDFPKISQLVDFKKAFQHPDTVLDGVIIHPDMETINKDDDDQALSELNMVSAFVSCQENPIPWTNKPWRTADSLKQLMAQVNLLATTRSKASDGTIGDTAHASRTSDHNPWVLDNSKGIVTALDITHDPQGKCDCNVLASSLQLNKDFRVKYVIWNKRIMNSSEINSSPAWTWRSYTGSNPHDKHIHISVKCDKDSYDSKSQWNIRVT